MTFNDLLQKKIAFISLGCDKNRVDLEKIMGKLSLIGFPIVNIEDCNIVVINTCSFIKSARVESINNILQMAQLKNAGKLEKIIVTGCLNEMNYSDLASSLPEVDMFVRINDNDNLVKIIANMYAVEIPNKFSQKLKGDFRTLSTPGHYAYLKISDGCNNFCSYCTIPYIRGRYKSEPIEKLVTEAELLVKKGVTEIILVAQDVTRYGEDLYGNKAIVPLIKKISEIKDLKWIRLLYCYPKQITPELISEIANNNKVCKYIDIPFQHIDSEILKRMNRKETQQEIEELITTLRSNIKDIAIRSTFILGFPGETDEQFNRLSRFISKYKLNQVGFFKYSKEDGTVAGKMPNQVPAKTKSARLKALSKLQFDVVLENNSKLIGSIQEVVVDRLDGKYAVCRSQYQCPDVDSLILVPHNNMVSVGDYYKVKLTKVKNYDLMGEFVYEFTK